MPIRPIHQTWLACCLAFVACVNVISLADDADPIEPVQVQNDADESTVSILPIEDKEAEIADAATDEVTNRPGEIPDTGSAEFLPYEMEKVFSTAEELPPVDLGSATNPWLPLADESGKKRFKPITELTASIALPVGTNTPEDFATSRFAGVPPFERFQGAATPFVDFSPFSARINHQPLYFEDPNSERLGITWGRLQPGVSAAKFYGRVALLPASLVLHHPRSVISPRSAELPITIY